MNVFRPNGLGCFPRRPYQGRWAGRYRPAGPRPSVSSAGEHASYCVMIVLLASRARSWLSRVAVRRRLERVLGATLVALGIDLAAASR